MVRSKLRYGKAKGWSDQVVAGSRGGEIKANEWPSKKVVRSRG